MDLVGVYGSLRKGLSNHFLLENSEYLGQVKTPPEWSLYDLGAFPALVPAGKTAVVVEVYRVTPETLVALDQLEDYPEWYQRQRLPTPYGDCWIYYHPQQTNEHLTLVPDGDWMAYYQGR